MIIDTLQKDIIEAMKAGDQLRVSTFKLLLSEIKNFQIDHPQMTADEELNIVKKEAKKRKDAVEAFTKAGRTDLSEKEAKELAILQEFLPAEMSEEELQGIVTAVVNELKPTGMQDMGRVIGLVMQRTNGQADGGRVSGLVKEKLASL